MVKGNSLSAFSTCCQQEKRDSLSPSNGQIGTLPSILMPYFQQKKSKPFPEIMPLHRCILMILVRWVSKSAMLQSTNHECVVPPLAFECMCLSNIAFIHTAVTMTVSPAIQISHGKGCCQKPTINSTPNTVNTQQNLFPRTRSLFQQGRKLNPPSQNDLQ